MVLTHLQSIGMVICNVPEDQILQEIILPLPEIEPSILKASYHT